MNARCLLATAREQKANSLFWRTGSEGELGGQVSNVVLGGALNDR